jgi:hypothetical protein
MNKKTIAVSVVIVVILIVSALAGTIVCYNGKISNLNSQISNLKGQVKDLTSSNLTTALGFAEVTLIILGIMKIQQNLIIYTLPAQLLIGGKLQHITQGCML